MVLLFADVMSIGEAAAGGVDLHALEAGLRAHAHRPLRVGAFSAASNVTGILSDVDAITASLHAHGVPSPSGSTRWRRPLCRRLAEDGDARMATPRGTGTRPGAHHRHVRSLARLRLRKLQMAQMAPAMLGVPPPPRAPRRRLACQGGDCERHLPSACKPERAQDASTAHAKEEIASAISMLAPFSHSCRGRCTAGVSFP